MNIYCKNRINLGFKDSTLLLDPKVIETTAGCIFISHAHSDHLPIFRKKPSFIPPVVCSQATARLFYERIGYKLPQKTTWNNNDFTITATPSGHTFDSTVAEILNASTNELIIYTGDINIEDRGYLKGYQPKKCDILILESTYGDIDYKFPSFNDQFKLAREFIQTELDRGYPVALLGYPLGKSQLLNYCFGDLSEYRFSSEVVWKMEQIHLELGVGLYKTTILPNNIENHLTKKIDSWLLFYNHSDTNDPVLQKLKKKYNLKIVGFSGWAKNENDYKYQMGVDAAFIISDHCDYKSLLEVVRKSQPKKIFTVFGDPEKLARDLQKNGFNAVPLKEGQSTLDLFFQ